MRISVKHDGNITMEDVYKVTRFLRDNNKSLAKTFAGTVKEVLGTCVSVGCTVEGESPKELQRKITAGEMELAEK